MNCPVCKRRLHKRRKTTALYRKGDYYCECGFLSKQRTLIEIFNNPVIFVFGKEKKAAPLPESGIRV